VWTFILLWPLYVVVREMILEVELIVLCSSCKQDPKARIRVKGIHEMETRSSVAAEAGVFFFFLRSKQGNKEETELFRHWEASRLTSHLVISFSKVARLDIVTREKHHTKLRTHLETRDI